jgi:hypothetical protein
MPTYTVTIQPDDGHAATTVISLEVNGAAPRITRLELIANDGASLSTAQLPEINLELLLASVLPAAAPAAVTAHAPASIATDATPPPAGPPPAAAEKPVAATPKPRAAKKATAARAAKQGDTKKTPRNTTSKAAAPKPAKGGRTYRTMPDDFVATYQQAKTIAAVADYYAVPHHTAQGWMNTARRRGLIAPARSRSSR